MAESAANNPTAPAGLRIRRTLAGEQAVLALEGELDLAEAPELERQLRDLDATSPRDVVIDLSDLSFMDSTGLALMYWALQSSRASGHRLTLRRGQPQVHRLFELTGMVDEFTFAD